MVKPLENAGYPAAFVHPAAGLSRRHAERVAVRWATGDAVEEREALLRRLNLVPATLPSEGPRPTPAVNRTDGLWWVQRADGQAVDGDVIAGLQDSELVEWAAPAYRGGAADAALFAVNPTRLLVPESAGLPIAGQVPAGLRTTPDVQRPSRVPGLVAMKVAGRTAIEAAAGFTAPAAGVATAGDASTGVRFETVPFMSPTTVQPNDPEFVQQWGLRRIELPSAWDIVVGDPSIVIAVIDTGVELAHPDLDVHPQSWNASSDTPDGGPTGDHGTACAGIAAARWNNGQGVAGVAGGARIMAIATATWADADIAEGLYFAVDNGAHVISMSFGVYPEWGVWDFELIRDALAYAYEHNVVLVAASGNEDMPVARFPGSDARTICVGGSNRSDERKRPNDASVENPQWGASYGPDVDVAAPCLQIPTTDRLGGAGYSGGDYFDRFNGTSAATPHVAGIAALILSLRPGLSNVQVRHIIERTCDKISPNRYAYRHVATKPSGTWHEEVGYGRVNALRAIAATQALPALAVAVAAD